MGTAENDGGSAAAWFGRGWSGGKRQLGARTPRLVEQIGSGAGGVPFAEGDGAVPAFVYRFFEGLEHRRSVLGFVAFEGALVFLFILFGVGHVNGEVGRITGVERKFGRPDRVEGLGLGRSEARVVKSDSGVLRLEDLGDCVGDQAVVGMAVAAIGAPSDDDLRVELVD